MNSKNTKFHETNFPTSTKDRPTLSEKDTWDILRSTGRKTPGEIYPSINRESNIFVQLKSENKKKYCLSQIQNRSRTVDKHYLLLRLKTPSHSQILSHKKTDEMSQFDGEEKIEFLQKKTKGF